MCILPIIKYFLVAFHKTFFFYRLVIKTTVETFEKKFNSETDKNYNSTFIHVQWIRCILFDYEWLFRLNT